MRRADIDQPSRRDPPRQRRDREPGQGCGRRGRDAAADKGFAPCDAGLVERADARPRARRRAAPASPAAGSRRGATASAWRQTSRIRLRSVSRRRAGCLPGARSRHRVRRRRRRRAIRARSRSSRRATDCGDTAWSRSSSGTSSGPGGWSLMPSDNCWRAGRWPDRARSCACISARAESRNAAPSAVRRTARGERSTSRFSEHGLQPLQLHADGGLRGAQRLGGAGKALQFGDQQEGLLPSGYRAWPWHHHDMLIIVMSRDKVSK